MATVHGVRIYPRAAGGDEATDFLRIFRPLAAALRGHTVATDFMLSLDEEGNPEDPLPSLGERFGTSLLAVDVKQQLALLRGDDLEQWGAEIRVVEGALLPVFRDLPPPFEAVGRLFRRDPGLTSATWPPGLRAVIQMWDDIYWQLFTTERADVDALIRAHAGDPALAMFFVELDREFPDPSNDPLRPAAPGA